MQPPPPTGVPAAPIPPAGAKITILPENANGLRKRDGGGNPACRPHHPDFYYIILPQASIQRKISIFAHPFGRNPLPGSVPGEMGEWLKPPVC